MNSLFKAEGTKEFYVLPGKSLFKDTKKKIKVNLSKASDHLIELLKARDRTHLVKKIITNKKGKKQTVWVNPKALGKKEERSIAGKQGVNPSDKPVKVSGREVRDLGVNAFVYKKEGGGYAVAETTSGLGMTGHTYYSSQKAAVEGARANIEHAGLDRTKELIADAVKDRGAMPGQEKKEEKSKDINKAEDDLHDLLKAKYKSKKRGSDGKWIYDYGEGVSRSAIGQAQFTRTMGKKYRLNGIVATAKEHIDRQLKEGYKLEEKKVVDKKLKAKDQKEYEKLRETVPFGNPNYPTTAKMLKLKDKLQNDDNYSKLDYRFVAPDEDATFVTINKTEADYIKSKIKKAADTLHNLLKGETKKIEEKPMSKAGNNLKSLLKTQKNEEKPFESYDQLLKATLPKDETEFYKALYNLQRDYNVWGDDVKSLCYKFQNIRWSANSERTMKDIEKIVILRSGRELSKVDSENFKKILNECAKKAAKGKEVVEEVKPTKKQPVLIKASEREDWQTRLAKADTGFGNNVI